MPEIITTDHVFSADQQQKLVWLSNQMIPPEGGMPGGGDDEIMHSVLSTLISHQDLVQTALQVLDELAALRGAEKLSALNQESSEEVIAEFREQAAAFVQVLQSSVLPVYYRQDRVLESLGLPARAPFPSGNVVDKTDWSLLDPVRNREPFFREVD